MKKTSEGRAGVAAPPAVSPLHDSETFRDKLGYRVSGDSGCTFILGLVLCIVCPPGGSSEDFFFLHFVLFVNSLFALLEPLAVVEQSYRT